MLKIYCTLNVDSATVEKNSWVVTLSDPNATANRAPGPYCTLGMRKTDILLSARNTLPRETASQQQWPKYQLAFIFYNNNIIF